MYSVMKAPAIVCESKCYVHIWAFVLQLLRNEM